MKTLYVCQLDQEIQDSIRKELTDKFIKYYLPIDLIRVVNDAMDSKVSDLNEVIDIKKYIDW